MGKISMTDTHAESGIKVLDRAVAILTAVASRPHSLAELCEATGLPRATAHRLATALETHRMLARTSDGRWSIGSTFTSLCASTPDRIIDAATPIMATLMESTNESVQLYRLTGTSRTCIAAVEPSSGLQNTVPVGSRMPLTHGSAARVFMAYASEQLKAAILPVAAFDENDLAQVRTDGYASTISEREQGLASITMPIFDHGQVVAALSVSGPTERFLPSPEDRFAEALTHAARALSEALA
ncbi:IclR family transcriptional regulator [Corynebacterium aquilae]|uniref:IclR family transcriptional regulator n=1 Tax=Corynebacterium aquilae DSM 44791 TaxID=1431546 RepID=A0A1L7CFM8_9CORY|nr:IclR family transcriptional regulator [Corynebacterium aquilae]APT84635.1 IclR family transcriptional regulator [Corynebacterium aquilae DSM 44791]